MLCSDAGISTGTLVHSGVKAENRTNAFLFVNESIGKVVTSMLERGAGDDFPLHTIDLYDPFY